jgi:hypothetical protein
MLHLVIDEDIKRGWFATIESFYLGLKQRKYASAINLESQGISENTANENKREKRLIASQRYVIANE